MEPVDYLKILRNHWKAVVALIVVAVGAAFYFTPAEPERTYTAQHVLGVDTDAVGEGIQGPASVIWSAGRVRLGEMPERAAEQLGWQGELDNLTAMVEPVPDPETGQLTITATSSDETEAVMVANAFGVAWIDYVAELESSAAECPSEEDTSRRLAEIETVLERGDEPPNAVDLRQEQRQLELCLDDESGAGATAYTTLEEAREAEQESAMFATRTERMLLAAGLAGLIGFGLAILLDRNDSRIRTKEQAEKRFGLPVLSEVPLLALRDRGRAAVVAYEREPRMAEAYRNLRTALLLVRNDALHRDSHVPSGNGHSYGTHGPDTGSPSRQLVVVTSAEPGEGKSTSAANLALAYAEAGHSVLLLTWDLWRPINPSVFGVADGPGVSDYLEDDGPPLVHYVQDTSVRGVRIVTAGTQHGQPSPRPHSVRRMLDDARTLADVVVVDTAPLLSASVTRELATLADAVVVVSRVGRTTAEAADRCAELFERTGAPALGVVLVGVGTGAFSDYYGPARKAGYNRASPSRGKSYTPAGALKPGVGSVPGSSSTSDGDGDPTEEVPVAGRKGRHLRTDSGPGGFRASSHPDGTGRSPGGS